MKPATQVVLSDGNTLPFSFGMAALSNFLEDNGWSLQDLGQLQDNLSLSKVMQILHHGFRDGHRREKLPFALTLDDIGDLIDENPTLITRCMDIFAASMPALTEGNEVKPGRKKPG
jgi:hypothetical protein